MAKNCVCTYEQYKERLLKMKPNVYLHGKKLDRSNGKEGAERDLADWIVGGTYVMKQCYDTANDPRYADVCTVTSHLTGNTINRSTHIHHSKEDLLKKQLMTRLICLRHLRLRPGLRYRVSQAPEQVPGVLPEQRPDLQLRPDGREGLP